MTLRRSLTLVLPEWAQDWLEIIVPGVQIALILLAAWLLQNLLGRLLTRVGRHYQIPLDLQMPILGLMRWTILAATLLLVLERLGVSATVLWTGFTGFATVGAVAFFAAWSVLSNLFCAFLIFTVGPFRLGDTIELLDTADKAGARGRVVDINLLYTTLEDTTEGHGGALLQIPNTLIFQRVLRRWEPSEAPSPTPTPEVAPQSPAPDTPAVP